jgi:hypothetical protein
VLSEAGHSPAAVPLLSVADIPQTAYRDWAAIIIPVDPEYAMHVPTRGQLWRWYGYSLGGIGLAAALAGLLLVLMRSARRLWKPGRASRAGSKDDALGQATGGPSDPTTGLAVDFQRLHAVLVFGIGAAGTTLVSAVSQQFVFTWPLCLFVLFQATVYQARWRRELPAANRWLGLLVLCAFLALGLAYFLVCRRLSLVSQWAFLSGFAAAVPLLLWARRQSQGPHPAMLGELLLLAAAYSAYYWASAGILWWKYDI